MPFCVVAQFMEDKHPFLRRGESMLNDALGEALIPPYTSERTRRIRLWRSNEFVLRRVGLGHR